MKLTIIMGDQFADIDFDDDILEVFSAHASTTEMATFIAKETIPYYEAMLKMKDKEE